jgi:GTP cyclohydrolase-4
MLPDVQTRIPGIKLHLTRVGVKNVRKLLKVPRGDKRPIILLANIECYVDLPAQQKGTHMSRNLEAINEIIEEIVQKPVYELERLCEDIVTDVFKRHEYASKCEVDLDAKLMLHHRTPRGRKAQNFVKLIARGEASRGRDEVVKEVGAEVRGMILHPYGDEGGCAQRAAASLTVETKGNDGVRIDDIVEIIEHALGSRAYSSLTADEEKDIMEKACKMPKFADDVVDDMLRGACMRFPSLPRETKVVARCIGEDSLFTFDSISETVTTLGEARVCR